MFKKYVKIVVLNKNKKIYLSQKKWFSNKELKVSNNLNYF